MSAHETLVRRSSVLGCELVAARELIVAGADFEISSGMVDFSEEVALPSTETPACAKDRTNSSSTSR